MKYGHKYNSYIIKGQTLWLQLKLAKPVVMCLTNRIPLWGYNMDESVVDSMTVGFWTNNKYHSPTTTPLVRPTKNPSEKFTCESSIFVVLIGALIFHDTIISWNVLLKISGWVNVAWSLSIMAVSISGSAPIKKQTTSNWLTFPVMCLTTLRRLSCSSTFFNKSDGKNIFKLAWILNGKILHQPLNNVCTWIKSVR